MSLGIGLGAFMDSFQRGYEMRDRIDERKRLRSNRDELAGIERETQESFQRQVESGEADANQFDQFWTKYGLPRRKMALLRQGDVEGARHLEEWGQSAAAREGGKLFSRALLKAQTGDAAGALQDAIAAAQVPGYLEHGYELVGQDTIVDEAGNTIGFRLKVKDPSGKEIEQDIAVGDVPRVVSIFANPDAAWASQTAAKVKATEKQDELTEYEAKKKIDRRYKDGDGAKRYADARKERVENDLTFGDLTPEEQDARIRADLEAADAYARENGQDTRSGGQAAPPGGPSAAPAPSEKVIVDETTGEMVSPPAAAPTPAPADAAPASKKASLGLGEVERRPLPPPQAVGLGGAAPAPAPQAAPSNNRAVLIQDAADHIAKGGNPEYIAQRLLQAGVPEQEWPEPLRRARQRPTVGLAQ